MKKNLMRSLAAVMTAAVLCSCNRNVPYPEGVDGLPSHSAKEDTDIKVYYDTSARPELDTGTETEQSESITTSVPVTEETEEETTVTVSSEDEPEVITWQPDQIPDIGNVPTVGISEYYNRTQTMRTQLTEITTTASLTDRREEPVLTGTVTAASTQTESITTSIPLTQAENLLSSTASEVPNTANVTIHQELSDGRISKYTGREIISHPMCYYYLEDREKKLYDKLTSALLDHEESVSFSLSDKLTFEELFDSYQIIFNNEYRLFYISTTIEYIVDKESGYIKSVDFVYNYDKAETEQMKKELETEADKILSQITPSMGDYEIVKLFHDSVITSCVYEENKDQNTIYGTLVKKQALCQGYSKTFTYLCSQVGIRSAEALGIANEEHMWNIVQMDGDFYHVDLTWDDPDKKEYPDSVRYDYFGLTDYRIMELRSLRSGDFKLPAATGTKYHYYNYNGLTASSVSEAEKLVSEEALKLNGSKGSTVQFMCTDSDVFDAVTKKLFSSSGNNVITVLDKVNDSCENKINTDTVHHNSNKNTRTVKIYLEYK